MSKQRFEERAKAAGTPPASMLAVGDDAAPYQAIALRKHADGTFTAATLTIEGDRVTHEEPSKPNFRSYAEQQFRMMAGRLFHKLEGK